MSVIHRLHSPLGRYGHNITMIARQGGFSPLMGRDEVVNRIFQILLRETKNRNPVLIDDDEGKRRAVVIEAIRRMALGEAPDPLPQREVIALDYEALLAGPSTGVNDVRMRLQSMFTQMQQVAGALVLWVDDVHRLVGEGSPLDVSVQLKPALHCRRIQLLGVCPLADYRRDVERNAPIWRCTVPVLCERLP